VGFFVAAGLLCVPLCSSVVSGRFQIAAEQVLRNLSIFSQGRWLNLGGDSPTINP